ncbi:MAG: aminomethyltransferase beta-barrel domain-containing protein [Kiritimatiellia bacterium]
MRLFRGRDRGKDQSYFLARLSQAQLAEALFPLGELAKTEVLALARSNGFGDLAGREESQDFIAGTNKDLLFDPSDERPGPVMDTAGRVLGRHPGIVHCTVGQRQGIGVAAGERRYVKAIDAATDTVVVGRREELFRASCGLDGLSWIAGAPPGDGTRVRALLRYRHAGADAAFRMGAGGVRLDFDVPQFAVAPGQAAVLYAGDEVLGAGWILPEGNGGGRRGACREIRHRIPALGGRGRLPPDRGGLPGVSRRSVFPLGGDAFGASGIGRRIRSRGAGGTGARRARLPCVGTPPRPAPQRELLRAERPLARPWAR